jgi:L-sorbose 1-phosphate reductase
MCCTDVKEIVQGESHPRLTGRNLITNQIIPGHELSMMVIVVGERLKEAYNVDR